MPMNQGGPGQSHSPYQEDVVGLNGNGVNGGGPPLAGGGHYYAAPSNAGMGAPFGYGGFQAAQAAPVHLG